MANYDIFITLKASGWITVSAKNWTEAIRSIKRRDDRELYSNLFESLSCEVSNAKISLENSYKVLPDGSDVEYPNEEE